MTMIYLSRDSKLWCHTQVFEACLGQHKIKKWEEKEAELKKHFLPSNTSWFARIISRSCNIHVLFVTMLKTFLLCCWM